MDPDEADPKSNRNNYKLSHLYHYKYKYHTKTRHNGEKFVKKYEKE